MKRKGVVEMTPKERMPKTRKLRDRLRKKYKNQEEVYIITNGYIYMKGKGGDVTTTDEGQLYSPFHEEE